LAQGICALSELPARPVRLEECMAGKTAHVDISRTTIVPRLQPQAVRPRAPRLWACVLVSLVVNSLAALLLGHFWGMSRPMPSVPAPRVMRVAVLPTPPKPPKPAVHPPRVPPRPKSAPRRHLRVVRHKTTERPRLMRRATTKAPSAHPHPTEAARPAPAGRGRQTGHQAIAPPALAPPAPLAPAAAPTLTPARVARIPLLKPKNVAAPVSLAPVAANAPPALPAAPSGGAAGQGRGRGDAEGRGQGGSSGSGSGGGGGPFGIGSGGAGGGEGLRHIVYVLDISGSMTSRIDRARQELKDAMAGLVPGESFGIVTFSDHSHVFDNQLDAATPDMVARASYFLSTLQIGGGTNLDSAMRTALGMPGVNVVVLITDGDPTEDGNDAIMPEDEARYFSIFTRRVREINTHHARIYTIGLVGKNPFGKDVSFEATRLLQQLSRDSGGVSKIVPLGTADPQ